MKKMVMYLMGAMMVLSLAACTPTTDKGKTGEVKQTQAANGVADNKQPDPDAPDLDMVAIYHLDESGTKLTSTMEAVEETTPQALVDLLIQHGVLAEGTKSLSFESQGKPASKEVGPGIVEIPGMETETYLSELGILDLSEFPEQDADADKKLEAVANTFIENMDVVNLNITINGETYKEGLTYATPDAEKEK